MLYLFESGSLKIFSILFWSKLDLNFIKSISINVIGYIGEQSQKDLFQSAGGGYKKLYSRKFW